MKKIRIGVIGAYRGASMIRYCKSAESAEVVAICDKNPGALNAQKERTKGLDIAFFDNFDDFIKYDMDAVVLANYANEHAPFAIKAMRAGKHVFSEVLPVQTMKEAVELVEAELHRIEARYMVENTASRRLMERVGMHFEGVHRQLMLVKGQYRDIGTCAILTDEFAKNAE